MCVRSLERKIAAQNSGRHDQVLVGDFKEFFIRCCKQRVGSDIVGAGLVANDWRTASCGLDSTATELSVIKSACSSCVKLSHVRQ
jgi:hypothetical protein